MSKFNINGLTDAQQQSCMSFMITDAERIAILNARGTHMTGFSAQKRPGSDSKVYFWSEGLQPSDDIRELIADKNPIRAAEKFLAVFMAFYESKSQYPEPRPKLPQAELKDANPESESESVIELSLCSFDEFLPEPGKTYRFVKNPGCPVCAQVDLIMGLSRRAQG